MTKQDAKTLICGLVPDGLDVEKLNTKARHEIRAALETVIRLSDNGKRDAHSTAHRQATTENQ
jgi:hypothetical protein